MPLSPKSPWVGSLLGCHTSRSELWGEKNQQWKPSWWAKETTYSGKITCSERPCFEWRVGSGDLQRSLPTLIMLWLRFIQHSKVKAHDNPLWAVYALKNTVSQCSDICNELYYLMVNTRPSCDCIALTQRITAVSQARGTLHKANGERTL